MLTSILILVFSTFLAPSLLWLSCCYCLFCCCSGTAVVNNNLSTPSVTTDVGFPLVNVVPSFFSIHAVVWHSAVDTGGKFAAVVADTG